MWYRLMMDLWSSDNVCNMRTERIMHHPCVAHFNTKRVKQAICWSMRKIYSGSYKVFVSCQSTWSNFVAKYWKGNLAKTEICVSRTKVMIQYWLIQMNYVSFPSYLATNMIVRQIAYFTHIIPWNSQINVSSKWLVKTIWMDTEERIKELN